MDWSVFHILDCQHTTPVKNKYTVIFSISGDFHGFLINSSIHSFIKRRKHLEPCVVLVECITNNYLTHDSYIDCRGLYDFQGNQLNDHVGTVCNDTKTKIMHAVLSCPVLELKYKNYLLANYGGLINYP